MLHTAVVAAADSAQPALLHERERHVPILVTGSKTPLAARCPAHT